ncbi:S46 family peptidase [uncultured Paludibaculum sp.]|uniref:S46 family peptidase n=1 Tax=uncultured Paludibaculum sp. TaxID=1765020 RepID=UPI002AABE31B|nr:S46 family peptidase [uncultured Paludibaculum sp.]
MRFKFQVTVAAAVLPFAAGLCLADEGMWLLNAFPKEAVEKKYHFQVTDQFLDHLRLSAVRFNNGGTGSFVSPDGLLFTNHHVGADCIQKISSGQNDYIKNGFVAKTLADERSCPDLEVNVLLKIEDVTAKVTAGVTPRTPAAEANAKKKAAMSALEKACNASTGNRCDVVTLYSGGLYHLYQYRKYTDIRLVMAPEFGIAFFGGDQENFTYPRYNLDITFFRAYENGKPVHVDQYFKWAKTGVKEGDLTFVPGNPGSTGRLATVTELEFSASTSYPLVQRRLASLISALEQYMAKGPEQKRIAGENLFGNQNSYKAYTGFLTGLRDRTLMDRKRMEEKELKAAIAKDPARAEEFSRFWDELATTYQNYKGFYAPYWLLERGATRGSELLEIARDIVRYAEEKPKPDSQRLREYTDAGLPSLEQAMYSEAPIYPAMEEVAIENYFSFLVKELGESNPVVKAILDGKTPADAAKYYVQSSKLPMIAERKRLAASLDEVRKSRDGMIRLALILDKPARELRKRYEDQVESVVNRASGRIAQARFAAFGGSEYPDATFTMRLAYGDVRGYRDEAGRQIPYATDFAGFFAKGSQQEPFIIPPAWVKAKPALDLKTHFDFVTTNDTHGGNSGSATLNTKGEIVGILFDGNIESLPNRFVYTDERSRSVHVCSEAIAEALSKVYKADRLLRELGIEITKLTP